MRKSFMAALLLGSFLSTASFADTYSTSVLSPTPAPESGVIAGSYPAGGTETSYYFGVDLKAGALATQMAIHGGGSYKTLTFALLDGKGRKIDSYYITAAADGRESTRVFPIDASGHYVVRVTTEGPEAANYRVALGGSALPQRQPAASSGNSQSYLEPTSIPSSGSVSGRFPGGSEYSSYYFSADLKAGTLMTQTTLTGREGALKWASLDLLNDQGQVAQSYHLSRTEASADATRSFPIDHSGRHVLRLTVQGPETSAYKVEFGGDAFTAK
jgi:hypothetical protein